PILVSELGFPGSSSFHIYFLQSRSVNCFSPLT
uniref:Uncharacterized protein n=1 Tax=Aegilops tauschii subsp. strangulata TaxID=200361 RepID=A0A453LUE9_AEGTS